MGKLTGNNKDFLFKTSNFFKHIVLLEGVDIVTLKKQINNFTTELLDDGVIEDDSVDELKESLMKTFVVMIDNRQEGKYGKYFDDEDK
jgi:hypothetical protein